MEKENIVILLKTILDCLLDEKLREAKIPYCSGMLKAIIVVLENGKIDKRHNKHN